MMSSACRLFSRFGAKPPSSPTPVPRPRVCRTRLRVWYTSAPIRSASAKLRAPIGRDHELLQVDRVVRVHAAVEDVHQRHRQPVRLRAAEVAVQRQPRLVRGGLRHRHRAAQDRVGAQTALVGGAVELDHRAVDDGLVGRLQSDQHAGELILDVRHGLQDALAGKRARVPVAQLDRLECTRAGARGHRGAALGAARERHLDLDGRLTTRVQDLTGMNGGDLRHRLPHRLAAEIGPHQVYGPDRGALHTHAAAAAAGPLRAGRQHHPDRRPARLRPRHRRARRSPRQPSGPSPGPAATPAACGVAGRAGVASVHERVERGRVRRHPMVRHLDRHAFGGAVHGADHRRGRRREHDRLLEQAVHGAADGRPRRPTTCGHSASRSSRRTWRARARADASWARRRTSSRDVELGDAAMAGRQRGDHHQIVDQLQHAAGVEQRAFEHVLLVGSRAVRSRRRPSAAGTR